MPSLIIKNILYILYRIEKHKYHFLVLLKKYFYNSKDGISQTFIIFFRYSRYDTDDQFSFYLYILFIIFCLFFLFSVFHLQHSENSTDFTNLKVYLIQFLYFINTFVYFLFLYFLEISQFKDSILKKSNITLNNKTNKYKFLNLCIYLNFYCQYTYLLVLLMGLLSFFKIFYQFEDSLSSVFLLLGMIRLFLMTNCII